MLLTLLTALGAEAATNEGKRVALVIGNSKYLHAITLPNPASDARLMSATLRDAGFEVIDGVDLDNAGMNAVLDRFTEASYEASLAVIFYAGHGIQVDGKNFLIPVDAELTSPAHLKTRTIQVDDFLAALPPDPAVGVIILDACRDNPLARTLAASLPASRSASLGSGLAPVEAKAAGVGSGGILIAYATDPGAIAFDGNGANSPYTAALAKHLAVPGLEIQSALTRVRGDVADATEGRQRPWHNASLGREVFIGGEAPQAAPSPVAAAGAPAGRVPAAAEPPAWEIEQRLWDEASKRNSVAHYEAYLEQFPDGRFATVARLNIDQLMEPKAQAMAATDPANVNTGSPIRTALAVPEAAKQSPGSALTESAIGLDRDSRIDLQLRLEALGHELGSIDGGIGPKTRKAIGAWQAENGLPETTYLTPEQHSFLLIQTDPMMAAVRANYQAELEADRARRAKAKEARQKQLAAQRPVQKKSVRKTTVQKKRVQQVERVEEIHPERRYPEDDGGAANDFMRNAIIFGTGLAVGKALGE